MSFRPRDPEDYEAFNYSQEMCDARPVLATLNIPSDGFSIPDSCLQINQTNWFTAGFAHGSHELIERNVLCHIFYTLLRSQECITKRHLVSYLNNFGIQRRKAVSWIRTVMYIICNATCSMHEILSYLEQLFFDNAIALHSACPETIYADINKAFGQLMDALYF